MKVVFDTNFFGHVNAASIDEHGQASRAIICFEAQLEKRRIACGLAVLERIATVLLTLLTYSDELAKMEQNLLFDLGQGRRKRCQAQQSGHVLRHRYSHTHWHSNDLLDAALGTTLRAA